MATITQSALTMLDLAKQTDPKGSFMTIAQVLDKTNEIYKDLVFTQANGDSFHKYVRSASLPTGNRRILNAGVVTEVAKTTELFAGIAMFESYSEPDKELIDMSANPTAARNNQAVSFIEGMGQTMVSEIFYGSKATNPEGFDGLATQLNSSSSTNGIVLRNSTSTSGNTTTSIYIVQHGIGRFYAIYPKGSSSAGVSHRDLGEATKVYVDSADSNKTKMYQVYRDHFQMKAGIVIEKPKCVARLCNITPGDYAGGSGTNPLDPKKLIYIINQMDNIQAGTVIYCNRSIKTHLDILAYDKQNGFYTAQNIFGEPITMFRGIPVKLCEAILDTEASVS